MSIARFLTLTGGIALLAIAAALWVLQGVHERAAAGRETVLLRQSPAATGGWAVLPAGTARSQSDAEVVLEFSIARDPLPASPRSKELRPPRASYVLCTMRRDPPGSMKLDDLRPEAREKAVSNFEASIENPDTLGLLADEVYRRSGNGYQAAAARAPGQVVQIDSALKWGATALLLAGIVSLVVALRGGRNSTRW